LDYLALPLLDVPESDLLTVISVASNFIDKALAHGGKVLVHWFVDVAWHLHLLLN
jgi:hypothetical protein